MKKAKLFVIYFPIILVAGQVLVNLLSFVDNDLYLKMGFYLNTFFGTNVLFAIFLVAFTYMFKFCAVSRAAAIAECLFAVNFMIVQEDNLYNILFQVIVGIIALIVTFWHYAKKFPLCGLSLVFGFLWSMARNAFKKHSCQKGLEEYERNVKSIILKQPQFRKQQ